MDIIRDNVNVLRDSLQRNNYNDTTALDVLTAFYVLTIVAVSRLKIGLSQTTNYKAVNTKFLLCIRMKIVRLHHRFLLR